MWSDTNYSWEPSQAVAHGQAPPHIVDDVYEVPDDSAERVVTDRVRNNLLSVQIRSADRYNDQSRNILQQCIHLLPLKDRQKIRQGLQALVRNLHISSTTCVTEM